MSLSMGSSFFSDSTLNRQITQVRSLLRSDKAVRSSCEGSAILGKGHAIDRLFGSFGGLGDHIAGLGIVHDQDVGDDYEQEVAVRAIGAAVDDVRAGWLWFGLNVGIITICSDHF